MLRKWPREVSAAFGGWRDRAGQDGAITADNEDWRGVRTRGVAVGLIKWQLINSQVCVCVSCLCSAFWRFHFSSLFFIPLAFLHPLLALILNMASLIFFSLCQRSLLLNFFFLILLLFHPSFSSFSSSAPFLMSYIWVPPSSPRLHCNYFHVNFYLIVLFLFILNFF